MQTNPSNGVPGLLGKLGKLTSIRDTELLEQSLLRTLGPLLGVLDTALYRTDDGTTIARVIHHHRSQVIDASGVARLVERTEVLTNLSEGMPEAMSLVASVGLLGKPCTRKLGSDMLIAYPMFGDGEICGYFVFQRDREVSPTEDTIIRGVLEVFSNYYTLLDVSQRDRLTGLLNRQALEGSFDRIWNALTHPGPVNEKQGDRRSSQPSRYWLAVIDIDNFKKVNDEFGHMVGDEVLLLASRLMGLNFRATDLLYRYGGEEFVAIVSAADEVIAKAIFERLRSSIEAYHFPRVEKLTVSLGYSQIATDLLPVEVLSRADRALYQAKEDGRNRVYNYQHLVQAGVFEETSYIEPELF